MSQLLRRMGISATWFYVAALASLFLSLFMWFVRSGGDQRETAERLGIFVGLWPPTLMLLGKIAEDAQGKGTRTRRFLRM